jgi:beta-1,2-mannobiose phosphorylase / 1,2-beta-oligomannan phosphorylase
MNKILLERNKNNPILLPDKSNWWESKAAFNCAILCYDDKIHMLYRAIGEYEKYVSRIGYASSADGIWFDRSRDAAMAPKEDYEKYGIEDPRLVEIDRQIFLSYVILSDYVSEGPTASTALATTTDFKNYTRLGIITSKGSDNKDVVLFPEKTNNAEEKSGNTTYLFLHRPASWVGSKFGVNRPSIWLGEGNALTKFEKHSLLLKPEQEWEALKIGAGPPPLKTKDGWLLIYHGKDTQAVYRAGAALLDLKDPTKVLGRTKKPILEPLEAYEKNGDVNNVVFPTGACIMDGTLFVYYGAADKVCCLATINLESLLDYILNDNQTNG